MRFPILWLGVLLSSFATSSVGLTLWLLLRINYSAFHFSDVWFSTTMTVIFVLWLTLMDSVDINGYTSPPLLCVGEHSCNVTLNDFFRTVDHAPGWSFLGLQFYGNICNRNPKNHLSLRKDRFWRFLVDCASFRCRQMCNN